MDKEKETENCVNCKFCKNIHKEILIIGNNSYDIICGVCKRYYDMDVSENDSCSNFEERRVTKTAQRIYDTFLRGSYK